MAAPQTPSEGILKNGQKVRSAASGQEHAIQQFVAHGGQGEVYKMAPSGKTEMALKWYPNLAVVSPKQREIVKHLVDTPPPSPAFVWPIDIAEIKGLQSWGYLMPWIPNRFVAAADIMFMRKAASFRSLFRAAFIISTAFRYLHAKGYCYRDLNHKNAVIDPVNGDALVCDCDNVAFDGQDILVFHEYFAAPESWKQKIAPNWNTDIWGLAVFLFWLLVHHHPMIGRLEYAFSQMNQGEGYCLANPLFIFHPQDARNAPHPGEQLVPLVFWPRLPDWIHRLFIRTFTEGIGTPSKRVKESEWQEGTLRAYDAIINCAKCNHENFYDSDKARKASGKIPCINCGETLVLPPRVRLNKQDHHMVMLTPDRQLFPHHTEQRLYDLSSPTARVVTHSDGMRFALLNLSHEKWVAGLPDGSCRDVPPQQTIELTDRMAINFGKAKGEVRL